jgi:plastocyanin
MSVRPLLQYTGTRQARLVTPRHNGTETFIADHPGIFKFYCKHHLPGMVGDSLTK